MGLRPGDVTLTHKGQPYILRLSLGALFELNTRLSLQSPTALAEHLANLTAVDTRVLLACLMGSSPPARDPSTLAATLTDQELVGYLPDICKVFDLNFGQIS